MFSGSVAMNYPASGDYPRTEQPFDSIMPEEGQRSADPSTCVFWCAVAIGSLVKGRPIESVRNGVFREFWWQGIVTVKLPAMLNLGLVHMSMIVLSS